MVWDIKSFQKLHIRVPEGQRLREESFSEFHAEKTFEACGELLRL